MEKESKFVTRSHSQERNWLISLGNGNLVEGVKILIEQIKGDQLGRKINKSKK